MRQSAAVMAELQAKASGDSAPDDVHLVRCAQADPEAFGALYERYFTRIYRYVHARADSEEEAADLTQEVFLKAFDALPTYRERGYPFAAWLFRIARNLAIDSHRRRRPTIDWNRLPDALLPIDEGDPETVMLHREQLARLFHLIRELDTEKQDLLALRFAAGLTAREIASVVGKSETAIKQQFSRTLRALKEDYDEE